MDTSIFDKLTSKQVQKSVRMIYWCCENFWCPDRVSNHIETTGYETAPSSSFYLFCAASHMHYADTQGRIIPLGDRENLKGPTGAVRKVLSNGKYKLGSFVLFSV